MMERNKRKEFLDAEIVKKRRELEKQGFRSVESGIYAGDEFITFSEVKIFDRSMKLYLPDLFIDMPEEFRKAKYISANCPDILKSDIKGEVVFSFQIIDQKLSESEEKPSIKRFWQILKSAQPYNLFLENGVVTGENIDIAWMDYKGYGIDQSFYQLVYVLPVKGCMMLGTFHCPFYKMENWKPVIKEIMKTIYSIDTEEA